MSSSRPIQTPIQNSADDNITISIPEMTPPPVVWFLYFFIIDLYLWKVSSQFTKGSFYIFSLSNVILSYLIFIDYAFYILIYVIDNYSSSHSRFYFFYLFLSLLRVLTLFQKLLKLYLSSAKRFIVVLRLALQMDVLPPLFSSSSSLSLVFIFQ